MNIVIENENKISVDSIIFALFGQSVDELAKDIRDNANDQYNGIVSNSYEQVV